MKKVICNNFLKDDSYSAISYTTTHKSADWHFRPMIYSNGVTRNQFISRKRSFIFQCIFFTLQRSEWTPLEMKSVPGAREGSEEEGTELGETVCPCGKVYEETGVFMIQCDICRDWMHGECVRWASSEHVTRDKMMLPDLTSCRRPMWTSITAPSALLCVGRASWRQRQTGTGEPEERKNCSLL